MAPWCYVTVTLDSEENIVITVMPDAPDLDLSLSGWTNLEAEFPVSIGVASTHIDRTDYYYNESWQTLEERSQRKLVEDADVPCEVVRVQYLWDLRYIDSPVLRWRDVDGDGAGLDETVYYTTDANANVTALVNTSGDVVARYKYDPYGQRTTTYAFAQYFNTRGFAGYQIENASPQLYLVRNRAYDCYLGTWLQPDPAERGSHSYEYAASSPLLFVDPDGFAPLNVSDDIVASYIPYNLGRNVIRSFDKTIPWSPEGKDTGDLIDTLSDLNRRKNRDYLLHNDLPGPDSAWLWEKIQLIEEFLYGSDEVQVQAWLYRNPTARYGRSPRRTIITSKGGPNGRDDEIYKPLSFSAWDKCAIGLNKAMSNPADDDGGARAIMDTATRSLFSDKLNERARLVAMMS